MGRPPLGDKAMSNTERWRKWSAKRRLTKPHVKPQTEPNETTAALCREIEILRAQVTTLVAERDDARAWPQAQAAGEDFDARVKAEVERIVAADARLRNRKSLISDAEVKLIRIALHPDRAISDKHREQLDRASAIWSLLEPVVSVTAAEADRAREAEKWRRWMDELGAAKLAKRHVISKP